MSKVSSSSASSVAADVKAKGEGMTEVVRSPARLVDEPSSELFSDWIVKQPVQTRELWYKCCGLDNKSLDKLCRLISVARDYKSMRGILTYDLEDGEILECLEQALTDAYHSSWRVDLDLSIVLRAVICAYTMELPLYRRLNEELRKSWIHKDFWDNYNSLLWIAHDSLGYTDLPPASSSSMTEQVLYRGIPTRFSKLRHQYKIDQVCVWPGWSSASLTRGVAEDFAKMCPKSGAKPRRLGGVVFRITLAPASMSAVCIKKYSAYPDEDEYLLCPPFVLRSLR